jgi:hypothetical protein
MIRTQESTQTDWVVMVFMFDICLKLHAHPSNRQVFVFRTGGIEEFIRDFTIWIVALYRDNRRITHWRSPRFR